jgi:hypothetical protein
MTKNKVVVLRRRKVKNMVRVDVIRSHWFVRLQLPKEHTVFSISPFSLTATNKVYSSIVLFLFVTASETVGRPTFSLRLCECLYGIKYRWSIILTPPNYSQRKV